MYLISSIQVRLNGFDRLVETVFITSNIDDLRKNIIRKFLYNYGIEIEIYFIYKKLQK